MFTQAKKVEEAKDKDTVLRQLSERVRFLEAQLKD